MGNKTKAAEFANVTYNIEVFGRHIMVTDAMKNYAIEKISKIEKFDLRVIEVQVAMDIQKLEHRVDIVMKVNHMQIKSSSSSEDMYASIDLAADKLQQQLAKYKDRLKDHACKSLSSIDMKVNVFQEARNEVDAINEEIESENERRLLNDYTPHKIISQETRPLKVLTTDEAIMKLDLAGQNFLIFRSEEEHKIKVIYRRNDGNFAIIEVES